MGRKSKADERKLEILGHLYMILKEEGLEGASIAKIAERMSVNPSLLIHYFRSKDEMMMEMVDLLLLRYEEAYLQQLDNITQPEDRMNLVLDAVFGVDWLEVSDPEVFYSCYYMSYHNPRVKARFQAMYEWFKELLVNEIKLWMEHGLIAESDPEQIAEFIITLNEGTTYLWGIWKDKEQYERRGKFYKSLVTNMLQNMKTPQDVTPLPLNP